MISEKCIMRNKLCEMKIAEWELWDTKRETRCAKWEIRNEEWEMRMCNMRNDKC